MNELADLQRQMQAFVIGGAFDVLRSIDDGPRGKPGPRLAIYHDAYRIRLRSALADTFETLAQHLGDTAFPEACSQYVESMSSRHRNIRWYGEGFAEFLRTTPPYAAQPWLAEMAQFDWTLAAAFDAGDASCSTFEDCACLPPEAWTSIAFAFHPSVRRLALSTNAPAIRNAVDADLALPMAEVLADPVEWIVWRQEFDARFRSLHPAEARAIDAAIGGAIFPRVCEIVCEWIEPEHASAQVAVWLRDWVSVGLIAQIVVGPPGVEPGTNGL